MQRHLLSPVLSLLLLLAACSPSAPRQETDEHAPSQAGESMRLWAMARLFPDGRFHTEKYAQAMEQMRLERQLSAVDRSAPWEPLGPTNIGGRTLCLAFAPGDTTTLWAGSASGGLWKTTTGGRGVAAWERVETGFPVLGVGALAIDPTNPDVVYAGTGEVYNFENSMPNVAIRTTRGTYGIGILKTTDGGATWTKSLDWSYQDLTGVQDIKINPLRPATVYAATTEGVLRSYDAGATWQTVFDRKMAVDLEISPVDTSVVFVTFGSLDDQPLSGIFRSTNGGNTFNKLTGGLPAAYSGKTLLSVVPSQPTTLYASIGNAFAQQGLYRSTDNGTNWSLVNTTDVCTYQGWYSHDIGVNPYNAEEFIWTGIDTWKSVDAGATVAKKTQWSAWYFGYVPAGSPEGPPYYVHADIHHVYYHPDFPGRVYLVTDGGVFVSLDAGENWAGINGGYQTQQFYANFSNSTTNPDFAIGGMQDNGSAMFLGDPSWFRVLGGDGECTAINPLDDQIVYASYQYLAMFRSDDGGQSFFNVKPPTAQGEQPCFNGPFELAPSAPFTMYAGAHSLHRSDDGGDTWVNASGPMAAGDAILTIAVDPTNPNLVYCSSAPTATGLARVWRFNDATNEKTQLLGLPNRLCMDIAVHPTNPNTVYAVFAGFNTSHVWRSNDGGTTWQAIDNGLPDVPTNTLLIDPLEPNQVYVGNDLGVWLSVNGGASWSLYSADAPQALLTMHLSISADRKLRVASYGLGVWQTDLAYTVSTSQPAAAFDIDRLYPNPANDFIDFTLTVPGAQSLQWRVVDAGGRTVLGPYRQTVPAGPFSRRLDVQALPAGWYGLMVEGPGKKAGKAFLVTK